MIKRFTIPLPPITKKNSQRILINRATGKPFISPSDKFKEYQAQAGYYLGVKRVKDTDYPVNVQCTFYMPTRRKCDLTNLLEAIDDVFVHYGIVIDDDYTHIGGHDGSRVAYDKDNPRTEIVITKCRVPSNVKIMNDDAISRQAANARIKAICEKYHLSYEDGERKPATGGFAYALGHAFDDLPRVSYEDTPNGKY